MRRPGAFLALALAMMASSACLLGGDSHTPATPAPARPTAAPARSGASAPPSAPALTPLAQGTIPSATGSYVLEVASGRISKVSDLIDGVWSPDGSAIAFRECCTASAGYIDILDLDSGVTAHVLSGDARDLAWAPDSIHLAYVAMDRYLAAIGVYVVDRDGYNPHAVVKDAGAGEPRWMDDRTIAYSKGNQGDIPTFFVADISRPGSSKRLYTKDPPDAQDPRVVFGFASSDGVWVVYYEGTYHSDLGQTLAWNSLTGEVRILVPKLSLGEFAPGTHTVRLFLPDPDKTGLNLNQVFNLDTGVSSPPITAFESHWSADGKRLVYETGPCDAAGPASGLLSAAVDGTDTRPLSLAPGELEYDYAVAPAGGLVAYSTVRPGAAAAYALHIAPADGSPGASIPLGGDGHVGPGSWSPDGRYLLFTLGGGRGVCG
jgi:Tol biopolymer transport system component